MKTIVIAATALLTVCGAHAQQPPKVYGEIGYTPLKVDDIGLSLNLGLVRTILGAEFHPNLAIEGMLGIGAKDDTLNVPGLSIKAEVERTYGLYIKPKFKANNELELFARVGYSETKMKVSAWGFSESDSDSDVSYGAGLNYSFTPTAYGALDYMYYYNKDGSKIKGFTLGVGLKF